MIFKRIMLFVLSIFAASSCMVFGVYAEENSKNKASDFSAKNEMLTTDSTAPTISFDTHSWEDYVHLTTEGEQMGIKMREDTTYHYQGASLKVYSDFQGIEKDRFYNFADSVRNTNGELVYPNASIEGTIYATPGIELRAADFGLSTFDGCVIEFTYRLGDDVDGKLMDNSIYVFPTDEAYNHLSDKPVILKFDNVLDNNVSQYKKQIVPVAEDIGSTKIVFQTAILKEITSNIFYLDNIQILTPIELDGKEAFIKNVDSYNDKATPKEIVDEFPIYSSNQIDSHSDSSVQEDGKFVIAPFILIVAAGFVVVLAVAIIIIVIIQKRKFY